MFYLKSYPYINVDNDDGLTGAIAQQLGMALGLNSAQSRLHDLNATCHADT